MTKPVFDPQAMRARLREAVDASGKSEASIVKAANLGHGYLTNILKREKMPSVEKLHRLCDELNVSVPWVMYGIDVPGGFAEVFETMERNPKKFWALLQLLD